MEDKKNKLKDLHWTIHLLLVVASIGIFISMIYLPLNSYVGCKKWFGERISNDGARHIKIIECMKGTL